jgi:hypothetical protein
VEIPLNAVARVIQGCWSKAEQATADAVRRYSGPPEEFITFLFAGEFRAAVAQASDTRKIEKAFLEDLRREIRELHTIDVSKAAGLVARVNFHTRYHEGERSAADLGLVIRRPQVKRDSYQLRIEVNQDHATGLLAQAKLGHARKSKPDSYRWGGLTEKQEELFSMRRGYYSLLLYRLAGADKDDLKSFAWKVCNKQDNVVDVKEWLRSGTFPSEQPSPDLLKALFAGKIGTQESEVIKTIIEPNAPGSCTIELEIFWPDGKKPPKYIQLQREQTQRVTQVLRQ